MSEDNAIRVNRRTIYEMVFRGVGYQRWASGVWAEWMGDSLEIVKDDKESRNLEALFQTWAKAQLDEKRYLRALRKGEL